MQFRRSNASAPLFLLAPLALAVGCLALAACASSQPSAAAGHKTIDNVFWLPPANNAPGHLYVVMTRNFEPAPGTRNWTYEQDRVDLNKRVVRFAQQALQQAQAHTGDMRIVFFIRSEPNGTVGHTCTLTLEELRHVAADQPDEALALLNHRQEQWPLTRLPESVG